MRQILILLMIAGVGAAALAALWIFRGREILSFIDRYLTVEVQSTPIHSIAYEGSGTGGMLICDGASFSLNDVTPGLSLSVGSTKDNQLALASSRKVSRSDRSSPYPEILPSVSLLRRLGAIRLSSLCVTVFSAGRHRSIST